MPVMFKMDKRVQAMTKDKETLTPLVRQALSNPAAELSRWQVEQIHGGWGGAVGGTALYRVRGESEENGSWSLVLKILYERAGEKEESPYYWKREYELYRSGMLDQLPESGLTPPSIYSCADFSDSCWIWMADIQGEKEEWTLDDYASVSRRLGRFNGAYLTGLAIPDYPWLNVNWHCRIVPPLADTFDRLDAYLEHPLVQRTLPLAEKDTILAIWQERNRYCDALTRLPQTLCHIDAFRRNLFHKEEQTILIDWALAGKGPIGEDLTAMVSLPLYFDYPISGANDLDQAIFEGYLHGLRDAGWTGDAQLVRLGYTCAMTLRGLAGVKQDIELLLTNHPRLEQEYQSKNIEQIADRYADVRRFRLIQMADEARELLALLP